MESIMGAGAESYFVLTHIDDFTDHFTCYLLSLLRVQVPQDVNKLVSQVLYTKMRQIGIENKVAVNTTEKIVNLWSQDCEGENIFDQEVLDRLTFWINQHIQISFTRK